MQWGFAGKIGRLIKAGKFEEARALLRGQAAKGPKHENMLGVCQAHAGEIDQARETFNRALEHAPRSAAILNNMANLEFMQKDYDRARALYWRAIEESIWRVEPRHNLTVLYQYMGYSEKALSQHRDYLYLIRATRWAWIATAAAVIFGILIFRMV